jgi:CPA1 family monovalent cation:H+ antiporter
MLILVSCDWNNMFNVAVSCLALTAFLSYLNHKFIGLPTTIGVMIIALVMSAFLLALDLFGIGYFRDYEAQLLSSIDFSNLLMQGMLSLLLFAGALHVDFNELKNYRWQITILAVFGTLLSTLFVATAMWYLLPLIGVSLSLPYCLIFGALISPTDPIAVIGILKSAGTPKNLEFVIAGESLFNDGVAVVLFAIGLAMLSNGQTPTLSGSLILLAREAGGGILFGLALGFMMYVLLKSMDSYQDEVLITIAGVMGGYALASHIHVSGPLAMVVAGLIIGNHGRSFAMSDKTREHLDMFWDMLDSILNAVLFVLIGMAVILITFSKNMVIAATIAILVTLLARFFSAGVPIAIFRNSFKLPKGSWKVLTWGGLRGGISVALALSLPLGPSRDVVLSLTYAVVIFSILIQGLTIAGVIKETVAVEK